MIEHDIILLFNPIHQVHTVLLLIFLLPPFIPILISGTFFEIQNIECIKYTICFINNKKIFDHLN